MAEATRADVNQEVDHQADGAHKDASAALFDSVADAVYGKGKAGAATEQINNHGQIQSMAVPEGWTVKPPEGNPGIGTRSYQEVSPKDAPDASLSFFYRGLPLSSEDGQKFKSVLDQAPHALSGDELQAVSSVLSQKTPVDSDQFKLDGARTEDLNGKRVLVVDGSYPGQGQDAAQKIHEVYVNASGDGRAVQEIFYQAPVGSYDKHLAQAQSALQSIKWK